MGGIADTAGDVSNHICTFIEVRGVLAPQDCEAAMQRVVDRQEVMRLSILPGKDRPVQMIRASSRPRMRFHELSPQTGGQKRSKN